MAPVRIRAARVALGMTQLTLATESGLHVNTIKKLENGGDSSIATVHACQSTFERHGIEFFEIARRHGLIVPQAHPTPNAARLKAARAALLFSVEDLARLAGFGPRTVAKIENEDGSVRERYVFAYVKALDRLGVLFFDIDGRKGIILPPPQVVPTH